jgi:hypothetical protein
MCDARDSERAVYTCEDPSGMCARVFPDEDPMNPRTDWDAAATFVIKPNRYVAGDEPASSEYAYMSSAAAVRNVIELEHEPVAILPIYMLQHGSTHLSTTPFNDAWDSGQCGWAFVRAGDSTQAEAEDLIRAELAMYASYVAGEVYGVVVTDADGEEVDSCWGYYGIDEARAAAEGMLADAVELRAAGEHPYLPGLAP